MNEIEIIDRVINRLKTNWGQRMLASDSHRALCNPFSKDACTWCLAGAIVVEQPEKYSNDQTSYFYSELFHDPLIKGISEFIPSSDISEFRNKCENVWEFNDSSTNAEVIEMLINFRKTLEDGETA